MSPSTRLRPPRPFRLSAVMLNQPKRSKIVMKGSTP